VNPLAARIARRIARTGPLTVADFMAAALTDPEDGYYRKADPLGAAGDFTTAPEISQLFGELIGAWLVDCWEKLGRPGKVRLVELGPGRGTLLQDALRAGRVAPDWLATIELDLVEINPRLRQSQAERLSAYRPSWHEALAAVPEDAPLLLIANEFLDALPIRQLVFVRGAWRERMVSWNAGDGFHFTVAAHPHPLSLLIPEGLAGVEDGSVFELSTAAIGLVADIARRIAGQGGAALLIDYGRAESAVGESLQAVRHHKMTSPLDDPGAADLSAHVDFAMLRRAASQAGAAAFGPVTQGDFLRALGIEARAGQLRARASPAQAAQIENGMVRLISIDGMGVLFKALALAVPALIPSGFS